MPEIKNSFTQGKMNKDLDERLVPNGQYRDAMNIQVSTSEGSDIGTVQNILGNTSINSIVGSSSGSVCVGSITNEKNNKLYWFVKGDSVDAIIEYSDDEKVVPVLVDAKANTANAVLRFKNNIITGINIVDDLLLWTDNENEPRKINIERCKQGSFESNSLSTAKHTKLVIDDEIVTESIYLNANGPGTTSDQMIVGNVGDLEIGDTLISIDGFPTNNVIIDIDDTTNTITLTTTTGWSDTDPLIFSSLIDIKEEHITVIKKKPTKAPTFEITTTEDSTENLLFEKIFPRFSCRYKYEDGEYSAFGPFTDVVFKSNYLDEYDKDDSFTTKDVYNTGAVNIIKEINLTDFIAPDMPRDVVQVDILYKQENSNVVYSIDSIKRTDEAWDLPGSNQQSPYVNSKYRGSYDVITENIYAAVPSNQLLRPWDNVPKKALAQEVTGNRVVYGNYIQGYDFGNNEIDSAPIRPDVNADYGFRFLSPNFDNGGLPSIKSLRNYQLGIIYGDKYGRETPVFTSSNGAIQLGWLDKDSNLSASQSYQLKASTTSYFPEWADYYKIFIKETSGEYYNLVMDRVYPPIRETLELTNDLWISFFSTDRAKISEDDYIILKKKIEPGATQIDQDNKFKVIDIKNEAPDVIKYGKHLSIGEVANNLSTSAGVLNQDIFTAAGTRPAKGIKLLKINITNWLAADGSKLDDEEFRGDALYFSFYRTDENKYSKKYRITSAQDNDSGEYRVLLEDDIEEDWVSVDSAIDDLIHASVKVKFDRATLRSVQNLSGRFFVKIKSNALTKVNLENSSTPGTTLQYLNEADASLYWFADTRRSTGDYNDSTGIINGQQHGSLPSGSTNTPFDIFGNNVTKTEADWGLLTNGTYAEKRPMFIDSMYMASNQLNSSFDVKHEGQLVYGPRYTIPNGEDDGSGFIGGAPPPGSTRYPQNALNGQNMTNGLEGFVITSLNGEHVASQGNRRWKTDFNSYNLDSTYGVDDGVERYFLHLSFAVCGEDLWDGDPSTVPAGTLIPYKTESTGPSPSFGNTAELQYITNTKTIKLSNDPNFSTYSEEDVRIVNEHPFGHATLLPIHEEKYNNQWNPAWGGTTIENNNRTKIINAIHEKKKFKFTNDTSKTVYSIKSYRTKRIYNHTPWQLTYEVDAGGTIQEKTDSVEYAIRAWRSVDTNPVGVNSSSSTLIAATTEETAVWNKIADFGKANNRRLCYIIELDKDPTDALTNGGYNPLEWDASTVNSAALPDADTSVALEFIDISYDIPGGGEVKNPAIWETEPKENVDLDIYYEASQVIPINITEDNRELFAPIGSRIEFLDNPEAINGDFTVTNDLYLVDWNTDSDGNYVLSLSEEINEKDLLGLDVNYLFNRIRFHRKDGSYTTGKIVSAENNGLYNEQTDSFDSIIINTSIDPGSEIGLSWYNCLSFGNGIETDRIRDDFNAMTIANGVKASTTIEEQYGEEHRKNGMIYSGLYNSTSGVNNLNQFVMAEKITKDLNPTFGSIQKLFSRRISLIAFCEDRVVGITANKNALYNADGNPQIVASNAVLGDANPFVGDYGISKNPESFASESYRAYFTDKQRGAVLRLSMDGLTPISDAGMHDYFRDNLKTANRLIGTYDAYKQNYNLTLSNFLPGNVILNNLSIGEPEDPIEYNIETNFLIDGDLENGIGISFPVLPDNNAANTTLDNQTTIINHPAIPQGDIYGGTSGSSATSATYSGFLGYGTAPYVINTQPSKPPNLTFDNSYFISHWDTNTSGGYPQFGQVSGAIGHPNPSANTIVFDSGTGKVWYTGGSSSSKKIWHNEEITLRVDFIRWDPDYPLELEINLKDGSSLINNNRFYTGSSVNTGSSTSAANSLSVAASGLAGQSSRTLGWISSNSQNFSSQMGINASGHYLSFKIKGIENVHYKNIAGGYRLLAPVVTSFRAELTTTSANAGYYANIQYVSAWKTRKKITNGSAGTAGNDPIPKPAVNAWVEVIHNTLPEWSGYNSFITTSSNQVTSYGPNTGSGGVTSGTIPGTSTSYSYMNGSGITTDANTPAFNATSGTYYETNGVANPSATSTGTSGSGSSWTYTTGASTANTDENIIIATDGTDTSNLTQDLSVSTGSGHPLIIGNWYEVKLTGVSNVASGTAWVHEVITHSPTYIGTTINDGYLGVVSSDGTGIVFHDNSTVNAGEWVARWQQTATTNLDILNLFFYDFTGTIEAIEFADITETEQGGTLVNWTLNSDSLYNYYSDPSSFYYENGKVHWVGADNTNSLTQSFSLENTIQERAQDINSSPSVTNDGYELKFEISNYSGGGSLSGFVTGAKSAINANEAIGFEFEDIKENGFYKVLANMDGTTTPTITTYTDNTYTIETTPPTTATAAIKTVSAGVYGDMNRTTFYPTSGSDFTGTIDNISLKDITNYFTVPSTGVWEFTGFDPSLYQYITWDSYNENIVFTDAPDTVSLQQSITEHDLELGDTVKLKFDVTNYSGSGEISGYFFNKNGEGFSFGRNLDFHPTIFGIDSNMTYENTYEIGIITTHAFASLTGIAENEILRDTLVVFVSTGNFTGTLDNFKLHRIYLNFKPSTVTYSEDVKGWVSFKSFLPESGLSLSKDYYTIKDGELYKHHSNEERNNFYGISATSQTMTDSNGNDINGESSITAILNIEPSLIKIFNTLNYEGSQSKVDAYATDIPTGLSNVGAYNLTDKEGWYVDSIITDKQIGGLNEFIEKEGKWFNYIRGDANDIKTSDLSFQGLGIANTVETISSSSSSGGGGGNSGY